MQDSQQRDSGIPVARCLVLGVSTLLLSKVFLASVLDLYSDEVFYWQASANPAIAYSDLPFMTALLLWLGTLLDGYNTLAARSLFILMGSSLPFLVYWIAKPISGHRYAIESATLASACPWLGSWAY